MHDIQLEKKKMDVTSVCFPLLAGSDSQNNTTCTPNAASVTVADKVIKTKTDSTQVEGDKSEDELLKGLLTDDYCHVCEAVLLFESQRLSHYEGKKHAQKLRVYLQKKGAEKMNKQSTGPQRTMTTDKDRFCELCNMVFSSQVVAKSHYDGKVHTKNVRKQRLQPPDRYTEVCVLPSVTTDSDIADQKSASEGGMDLHVDPAASSTGPNIEVVMNNPNKHCSLCAVSFNNPLMALQHYNGRKHQKNKARRELIKELGDDVQQASSLMCQICSVQFNSVEMYQAHMQGNKHQVREKKVINLCKSQQKFYSTFADELADYIQVQKARGITPKENHFSLQADEEDAEQEKLFKSGEATDTNLYLHKRVPNLPNSNYQSRTDSYYPVKTRHSQNQGPSWPSHCSLTNFPPIVPPGYDSLQFPDRTVKRRHKKLSSSSSCTSSSSFFSNSSSYSSSTSDSDDSENRRRHRRRIRSRKDRCRMVRDEEQMRKQHRKERKNDSAEKRGYDSGESDQERRRKKLKHRHKRRQETQSQEEDCDVKREEMVMDSLKPEEMMDSKKHAEVHIKTEMYVEQENDGQNESAKTKYRKEKKKMKEIVDTRTEEEKLWDDSILGC